ncbi:hypothetical protein [Parabacteroides johnsonii]|uniref:hypothetical protein n=1 Tax=Parabacteroides johnsonii TaxID=387661 RepID=UPI0024319797|nr:hypothetical protein [Parabacteroides johnsonii]
MGFTIINASQFTIRLKATIHSSGKLGFTEVTARELGFGDNSFVKFAQDNDDKTILYLINNTSQDDEAFRVCKAGRYFYINTKIMFDSLDVDYKSKTVIFDLVRVKEADGDVYKLNKRTTKKVSKDIEE